MSCVGLRGGSQPGVILLPRAHVQWLGTVLVVSGGGGRPQAAGGWRSGMLTATRSAQDGSAQQQLPGLHVRSAEVQNPGPCILAATKEMKNAALVSPLVLSDVIEK